MPVLNEYLALVLPKGHKFQSLHLQSFPRKAANIFVDNKNANKSSLTIKTQHFVTLAENEIILFGLEVLVYVIVNTADFFQNDDPIRKIVYISKVDSTGLGKTKIKLTAVVHQVLKYLLSINVNHYTDCYLDPSVVARPPRSLADLSTAHGLKYLIESFDKASGTFKVPPQDIIFSSLAQCKPLQNRKIVTEISLFTRAEKQYLFPYSYKNKNKHILTDRGLLTWWLGLLNKLLTDPAVFKENLHNTLVIPGEDKITTNRYIAKYNIPDKKTWYVGGIYDSRGPDASEKAIYHIPLFPDDPKGRFLEHLVVEDRATEIPLNQFWNELAVRQEFRLASVVGIIHIEGISASNEAYVPSPLMADLPADANYVIRNGVTTLAIKVADFKKYGITVNNLNEESVILTNKRLKLLKKFITGENYSVLSDAKDAFENVNHSLKQNCRYSYTNGSFLDGKSNGFKEITGQLEYATTETKKASPSKSRDGDAASASAVAAGVQILTGKKKKRRVGLQTETN